MLTQVFKIYFERHLKQVAHSINHPLETQRETFDRLKGTLKGSEVARHSGFDRCERLEDLRNIPQTDCGQLALLFDRAFKAGNSGAAIFGPTKISSFARTSGSEGKPKDIPINQAYLQALDRTLVRTAACQYIHTGLWRELLTGKQIMLGSRVELGTAPCGLPIWDITGLTQTRNWRILRKLFIPNWRDLWIQKWPERAERILEQAQGRKVIMLIGLPALALDLIQKALIKYDVKHIEDAWPDLRAFVFGGVPLTRTQQQNLKAHWFKKRQDFTFIETYQATEAQIAFSFDPREDGMALNTLENLFLFLPIEDQNTVLFAHELEAGKRYVILITTPGGLINYRIGDHLEVLSTRPLLVGNIQREKEELSMTGEKITLSQLDLALRQTGMEMSNVDRWVIHWISTGGATEKPHLCWGIPEDDLPKRSAFNLDEALCRLNPLFAEALQQEKVIEGSQVVSIPLKVYQNHLSTKLALGRNKPKRIFNSSDELEAYYNFKLKTSSEQKSDD